MTSAIEQGEADEDLVADALRERGYEVALFGSRTWNPANSPFGTAALIASIRRSRIALRHAPDLLAAAYGSDWPFMVEVIRNRYEEKRCVEIHKLLALDKWVQVAPVVIVDAAHETAWWHRPNQWAHNLRSEFNGHGPRGVSNDPFAWFNRDDERPFAEVFPVVERP